MAGKIAWWLRENPRDPYVRQRRQIREIKASLTVAQAEDWSDWAKQQEFEDPITELKALRHFEKVRNS